MANTKNFLSNSASSSIENQLSNILEDSFKVLIRTPDLLDKPSAWFSHIPFANWLTHVARPRLYVELGSHAGVSYAAFCNAVIEEKIDAHCFAIDTWKGDQHSGNYSEKIYQELLAFNNAKFSHISALLRCTFDEAIDKFERGSIDLLHIDGLHTYEAVKHDFFSWLPKLSNRAIVLFHDTNEYKDDFGVWKFWGEIRKNYPSFEFTHGHGLGVLVVGNDAATGVLDLCNIQDEAVRLKLRSRFMSLGTIWEQYARRIRGIAQSTERLNKKLQDLERDYLQKEQSHEAQIRNLTAVNSQNQEILQLQLSSAVEELSSAKRLLNDLTVAFNKLQTLDELVQTTVTEKKRLLSEKQELSEALAEAASLMELEKQKTRSLQNELEEISKAEALKAQILADQTNKSSRTPSLLGRVAAIFRSSSNKASHKNIKIIKGSNLFDPDWYLNTYPDVAKAGIDPAKHYLDIGSKEGRDPSLLFSTDGYLNAHPDVRAAELNPLLHYLSYGQMEHRSIISSTQSNGTPLLASSPLDSNHMLSKPR